MLLICLIGCRNIQNWIITIKIVLVLFLSLFLIGFSIAGLRWGMATKLWQENSDSNEQQMNESSNMWSFFLALLYVYIHVYYSQDLLITHPVRIMDIRHWVNHHMLFHHFYQHIMILWIKTHQTIYYRLSEKVYVIYLS